MTFVSSDAVFTGPWMFHSEESSNFCQSTNAHAIRIQEEAVQSIDPDAFVARTNVFGWAPDRAPAQWIEEQIEKLESQVVQEADSVRHATPISAGDFAEVWEAAFMKKLAGVYHVAGAERVNPFRFVQRLAERLELPLSIANTTYTLTERPQEFGGGETSLETQKIRRALDLAMPMLNSGLDRLVEQHHNGFRDRLIVEPLLTRSKVA